MLKWKLAVLYVSQRRGEQRSESWLLQMIHTRLSAVPVIHHLKASHSICAAFVDLLPSRLKTGNTKLNNLFSPFISSLLFSSLHPVLHTSTLTLFLYRAKRSNILELYTQPPSYTHTHTDPQWNKKVEFPAQITYLLLMRISGFAQSCGKQERWRWRETERHREGAQGGRRDSGSERENE